MWYAKNMSRYNKRKSVTVKELDTRQEWEKPRPNLSIDEEARIIAMLVRGDSSTQIIAATTDQYGRVITKQTISNVRKRNKGTIAEIETRIHAYHEAETLKIRDRANTIIKQKLDHTDRAIQMLNLAGEQYLAGDITLAQYQQMQRECKTASLPELVTVSKEMHAQTTTTNTPASNPEDMAALRNALEAGDEVKLTQLVFKKSPDVG